MRGSHSSKLCILDDVITHPFLGIDLTFKIRKDVKNCWLYLGSKNSKGYGRREIKGKIHMVHRLVHLFSRGISLEQYENKKVFVMHKCDEPGCINPEHLLTGDAKSNTADRVIKGRCAKGENQGAAKLTAQDVITIRQLRNKGIRTSQIARLYKVHYTTINRIITRQQWKHL